MGAKPVGSYGLVFQGAGDQTDPSVDAQYVVFSSDAAGDRDVLLHDIDGAVQNVETIAGGPGHQDQPNVHRTTLAYRTAAGIVVKNWQLGLALRTPDPSAVPTTAQRCYPEDPVSQPVVSDTVAAWECAAAGAREHVVGGVRVGPVAAGDRTVIVARHRGGAEEYEISGFTDAHGPSAYGPLVAFVSGEDGSVWIHDASPAAARATIRVCEGRASGVSVGSVGIPVVAVARYNGKPDADIEIWDPTGGLGTAGLVTALVVPGEQRNPHLSGEWVAFEDLSTGRSQVVVWHWTSGLVFLPHPSTSNQTLNDLGVISATEVRVAFADDGDGTGASRDIALYRLAYVNGAIPDDGTGNPDPWSPPPPPPPPVRPPVASCDDDYEDDDDEDRLSHRRRSVVARLELGRDTGKPEAGAVSFDAAPYPGDDVLPVLVCVELERTSSGWVTFDDEALATPSDFNPGAKRLEFRAVVEGRTGKLASTIAGAPGARLAARVIADPGRVVVTPSSSPASSSAQVQAAASRFGNGGGCGTAGGAGPLAVLLLVALRLRRR